jgi:hypothetical protein
MSTDRDARRRELAADFTERLTRFRGQMTELEFDQLVADMVRTTERFAEIDARPLTSDPRQSDLLDNVRPDV